MSASATLAERAPATHGAARSALYFHLAQGFSFPTDEGLESNSWLSELAGMVAALPFSLRTSDLRWTLPGERGELQQEYIRLFQIGDRRGPPCSLHSGFYGRDRSRALQHLMRFYGFFGYKLDECVMPDHICVELEFVARLADEGNGDPLSSLRAQRDFLAGQLAWTRDLARRVRESSGIAYYRSLTLLTSRIVDADLSFIRRA